MRVKALAKEDATCALAQAARDALKVQLEEAEAKLQQANTHRAVLATLPFLSLQLVILSELCCTLH